MLSKAATFFLGFLLFLGLLGGGRGRKGVHSFHFFLRWGGKAILGVFSILFFFPFFIDSNYHKP